MVLVCVGEVNLDNETTGDVFEYITQCEPIASYPMRSRHGALASTHRLQIAVHRTVSPLPRSSGVRGVHVVESQKYSTRGYLGPQIRP